MEIDSWEGDGSEEIERYRCRVCGEISPIDDGAAEVALLCDDCFDQEVVARMHLPRDLEIDLAEPSEVRVARSGRGWMLEVVEGDRAARFLAREREELTQLGVDILREASTLYTGYTFGEGR